MTILAVCYWPSKVILHIFVTYITYPRNQLITYLVIRCMISLFEIFDRKMTKTASYLLIIKELLKYIPLRNSIKQGVY